MNLAQSLKNMSKSRILLVHNRYREHGGEDRVFDSELALLRDNGHEVHTFVRDNRDIAGGGFPQALGAVWNPSSYKRLRELIAEHNPAIVHFHNTLPLISPSGYYAADTPGVAVVQTLHNYRLSCANALFFRDGAPCEDCLGQTLPWRGIARRCYRGSYGGSAAITAMTSFHRMLGTWRSKVDAYIALSEFSREKFIAGGLPAAKIAVKPNFIPHNPAIRRKTEGYMLFVGRLSAEKGIETLLQAWQHLSVPIEIRIAGDGPLANLVEQAASQNKTVRWLGKISKQEVWEQLSGADALILPSLCYENFPLSLIEAGGAGIPAIASRHGALSELIQHGVTGLLFPPGNARDLADCVTALHQTPELKHELGHEIRAKFTERFSADTNYHQLMEIYATAVENKEHAKHQPIQLAKQVV